MRVLAIETATTTGSIAIAEDGRLLSEITLNIRATHSEKILAALDSLLGLSRMTIEEMDAVAVSIGPGSFTGLRIGLSAAKGLSYASGRPLIGIPTLDALSLNAAPSDRPVCPILDAKKGEVYTAMYRSGKKIVDDTAADPAELCGMIKEETVFLGNGIAAYGEFLRERLGGLYIEAPFPLQMPRASNVAKLAMARIETGVFDDAFSLAPRYLRKSEAELKWKG